MNFLTVVFIIIYIALIIKYPHIFLRRRRGMFNRGLPWSYDEILRENTEVEINENLINIRNEYDLRLQEWVKTHQLKNNLVNGNCELTLYHTEKTSDEPMDLCFYCKERPSAEKVGRFFYVKGDNSHVTTMFAIINMEFSQHSTYDTLKSLYIRLNRGLDQKSMQYYHENTKILYPEPVTNKWAMNEFCKMEIMQTSKNEKYIYLHNIWNNQRFVYIKADKLILYSILSEFAKDNNKTETFNSLCAKYANRKDCIVATTLEPETKTEIPPKTEPEKTEQSPQQIKKFNERNLDL